MLESHRRVTEISISSRSHVEKVTPSCDEFLRAAAKSVGEMGYSFNDRGRTVCEALISYLDPTDPVHVEFFPRVQALKKQELEVRALVKAEQLCRRSVLPKDMEDLFDLAIAQDENDLEKELLDACLAKGYVTPDLTISHILLFAKRGLCVHPDHPHMLSCREHGKRQLDSPSKVNNHFEDVKYHKQ